MNMIGMFFDFIALKNLSISVMKIIAKNNYLVSSFVPEHIDKTSIA